MSFFDNVLKKYAPTYEAAQAIVSPREYLVNTNAQMGSPISGGATVPPFNNQMAAPPQDTAPTVTEANPFDQFDTAPHSPQAAPQPQMAAPMAPVQDQAAPLPEAQPQPQAQQPMGYDPATMNVSNGSQVMTEAQAKAAQANQEHLALLINNGAGKPEIAAYLKTQGIDIGQLQGLDAALAQRAAHPNTIIPVATADTTPAVVPEYHGADNGKLNSALHGALDGITLGAGDELDGTLSAGRGAIENALGYGDGKTMAQTYADTVQNDRQALSDSEHYHPWATFGGQVAGGLALAPLAPEAGLAEGALAVGRRAAIEGAVQGAVYGFNSGTGGVTDRLAESAKGAVGGAVLGGGLGAIGGRIAANRANGTAGREILDAADRLNVGVAKADRIQPLVGHTSDGGLGTLLTATAEPLILSGKVTGLSGKLARFEENAGAAKGRIADTLAGNGADNLDTVAARQSDASVPGSLANYEDASRQATNALYDHASTLAGDIHLQTPDTVAAIDRKLAEWRGVPGGVAGSQALQDLRNQLATSQWTVAGLRRLRTSFGDSIDSSNRTVKEAATALWPTLSRDITMGLRSQGLGPAARAYLNADRAYAERAGNLDSIRLILGDGQHSADTVADNISRMSKTDYGQLNRAISVLPADQQNGLRGAIVDNLGRANPGKQNAEGDRFSLETFLSQWDRKNLSDEAKAAILPAQTVRDLNDLATLAQANRKLRGYGNASRSGVTVSNVKQISKGAEILGAGLTVGAGAALTPAAIGTVIAALGGGRLLASPGVARALVRASQSGSVEILARRLSEAARRNPTMSQNILGVRDAVVSGKVPDHAVTIAAPVEQQDPSTMGADASAQPNPFDQFD